MFKGHKEYFATLYPSQLKDQIQVLRDKLAAAEEVWNSRANPPIEMWRCGECGLEDKDGDVICKHLMEVHNYPEEDANLTTERMWK